VIPDLIARRAELRPAAIALEDATRTLTYADLDHRAAQAATLLASQGIAEGDRVAFLARNRLEFFELQFACAKLGAILVPLNWRMPLPELAPLFAHAEPGILLTGRRPRARRPARRHDADPRPGR
jgi:fatty-acyl-CoA synthase